MTKTNKYILNGTDKVLFTRKQEEDVHHTRGSHVYPRMGTGFDYPEGPEPIYEVKDVRESEDVRELFIERIQ